MNIAKHQDFFDPHTIKSRIHIIGCGATGSTVAELLVRLGLTKITLWDFDTVCAHNIANQMFFQDDIGRSKVNALAGQLCLINDELEEDLIVYDEAYTTQSLSGYIFLAVDNIDTRRAIIEHNRTNPNIKAFIDFRLGLMDGQHYMALPDVEGDVERLLATMNFTHAEAKANTPLSACGTSLSVVPGIRLICALGVGNLMNVMMNKPYKHIITSDASTMFVDAF